MKKNMLILLIIFLQPALHAQKTSQARTDSLMKIIKTTTKDTTLIKALNILATDFSRTRSDTATALSSSALLLSKKINYTRGEADSYFSLGQIYANKPDAALALKNFENALKLYETIGKTAQVAETWYAMGAIYQLSNYDEALRMFKNALQAARQTNDRNLTGKVAYIMATTLIRMGDYNEALQYSDISVSSYSQSGNQTGLANCYVVSSRIHYHNGNIQQAIKDNYKALRIYEQTGNKVGMYNVYTGLGLMYLEQKNYPEALKSYLTAQKKAEEQGNKAVLANAYNNVGNTYGAMGNKAEALKAFNESLKLAELVGNKKAIANAHGNIGTIYSQTNRATEALNSYGQALKLYEEIGAKEAISIAYYETGQVYFNLKKPDESKQWVEKALQAAKQVQYKDIMSKSYLLLTQIDTTLGDYMAALEHHKLYIIYRDSISNAEAARHLIEQRMQYAFSKKEDSLQLQQALIAEQLDKQTLLTIQQQQQLRLKEASLELSRREKDVQMLSFLRTKAELQLSNEQKEKKLTLAEQQRALQQSELEKQTLLSKQKEQTLMLKDKELAAQKAQRNFWVAGAIALFILSFFIFRNYRNQRKANARLQYQQTKTEQALTELKAAQAQLIQSEKMASLGELTAGIAHEIQNPLNFVNNFSELNDEMLDEMKHELQTGKLEEALIIAGGIKENNSKINHHGKRADAIVKGMLQHSRSGSRKKEPTDINKLADEYLRLSYHGLRAKDKEFNAAFTTDFDEKIGMMEVVPQDIGRVLLNLYNNAFYAVNEKRKNGGLTFLQKDSYGEGETSGLEAGYEPTVWVKTSRNPPSGGRGAGVLISVRDNGNGIPKKALDKIYQPFFTTKPTGQGTGLGLSLSYDIIKAHGGELKFETREGEFAEFIIQLPVGDEVLGMSIRC